ncbi:pentapeptide repeat-containing protein [Paenibacillus humicus]|uniref:pentapeptide repeat-containing protein n=1 Tax=Paenibacillus humicus TaxID=412861 RepID=UPI003D292258
MSDKKMDAEEILDDIKGRILEPAMEEVITALEAEFHHQKEQHIEAFIQSFQNMCIHIKRMQDKGQKAPIAYIHFSFLRTSILQQKYTYLIEAYSEEWYGDENECISFYDASWAYKSFNSLQDMLTQKLKMYFKLFHPGDSERIMLEYIPYFHQFIVAIARMAVCRAVELPEAQQIAKSSCFRARIGEFKDLSEDIYVNDQREMSLESVRKLQQQDTQLAFEALQGLALQSQNLDNTEMRYADLSGSRLIECQFRGCIMIGTRFTGSTLRNSDFSHSLVCDADFSNSDLRGVSFRNVSEKGYRENLYRSPGLQGVSFANANLDGADFRGAALYDANFEGASLREAIFTEQELTRYRLSDQQLNSVTLLSLER